MARRLRVEYEGALYHAMNRGVGRRVLFRSSKDFQRFVDALEACAELHHVEVHAYALLANHFHLVVRTPRANLGPLMHALQTRYAVYFNRKYRCSGHVFQGPFQPLLVEEDDYLLRLSRYVHLNPVKTSAFKEKGRADVIKALRNYPWSSFRGYIGRVKRKDWVYYDLLEGQVESRFGKGTGVYRKYVEAGLDEDDEEVAGVLQSHPPAWGSPDFVQDIADRYLALTKKTDKKREDIIGRPVRPLAAPETVLAAVCEGLSIDRDELLRRRGGAPHRGVAALMLSKYSGLSQRAVAEILGVGTGAAISHRIRVTLASAERDKVLKRCIDKIEAALR